MTKVLAAVPTWAWWALGGAVALALGIWWHQGQEEGALSAAVDAERAQVARRVATVEQAAAARVLDAETKAAMAALENSYAENERTRLRAVADARAKSELGQLRGAIAALRRGGSQGSEGPSPISLVDAAPAALDALEQCGDRYTEVARVADELGDQVITLQDFITEVAGPVCIAEWR